MSATYASERGDSLWKEAGRLARQTKSLVQVYLAKNSLGKHFLVQTMSTTIVI